MSRVTQGNNGITQPYNPEKPHLGVDIGWIGGDNDNIIAHSDGTVVGVVKNINWTRMGSGSYGNYVQILHDNGYYTLYAHLAYNTVLVDKGDRVVKGQKIGYMGNTGQSRGKHLHFEVRTPANAKIDPTPYINADLPQGNNYESFVIGVQSTCGARVDGIAGPETLSKTVTVSKSKNWQHPVVRVLQVYLRELGYDLGRYGADGCFGNDMENAVKQYQKDQGLGTVDGILTAKMYTWKRLLKLN